MGDGVSLVAGAQAQTRTHCTIIHACTYCALHMMSCEGTAHPTIESNGSVSDPSGGAIAQVCTGRTVRLLACI